MYQFFAELTSPLTGALNFQDGLLVFGLMLARLIMLISLIPFLGSKNAPGPLKIGLAVLIALLFWPHVSQNLGGPVPASFPLFLALLLKEAFVGFTIGFVTAEIFYVVEMAGQIIDIVRGTNQVQLMVPELQERSSAIGTLNYQLLLALFLTLGFQGIFFQVLAQSFIDIPTCAFFSHTLEFEPITTFFATLLAHIFKAAVTLVIPIGIVTLLSDIVFGLLNRVAPQVNAYFLSMPAKAVGGLAMYFAAFPSMIDQFGTGSYDMLGKLVEVLSLMR